MSYDGIFEIEDTDIVRLDSDGKSNERAGWVNVGAFALNIHLNAGGDLTVAVHARMQEGDAIHTIFVPYQSAKEKGGSDPYQAVEIGANLGDDVSIGANCPDYADPRKKRIVAGL